MKSPPPRPPQRTDSLLSEEVTAPKEEEEEEEEKENEKEDAEENKDDFSLPLQSDVEAILMNDWAEMMGSEFTIIVAQINKFKEGGGLGISLEGTVEKVDGAEQNPHHYIR